MVAENQPDNNLNLPNDKNPANNGNSVVEWLKEHKIILIYFLALITIVLVIVLVPDQSGKTETPKTTAAKQTNESLVERVEELYLKIKTGKENPSETN